MIAGVVRYRIENSVVVVWDEDEDLAKPRAGGPPRNGLASGSHSPGPRECKEPNSLDRLHHPALAFSTAGEMRGWYMAGTLLRVADDLPIGIHLPSPAFSPRSTTEILTTMRSLTYSGD